MNQIETAAIVQAVNSATGDVFSTMLGLPVEPAAEPRRGADERCTFDGVVALVGIGGSWTGSGRIYCEPRFACRLAGSLLGTEYTSVDEEVLDAVAEVANMIIGNVKTSFEESLGPLALSVPTVIFGKNYSARSSGVKDWVVIPFVCDGEKMEVHFCLVPSRPLGAHLAQRPEAVLA